MSVPEAMENRIQDAILTRLQTIVGAPNFLTAPSISAGPMLDSVPASPNPYVFLEYAETQIVPDKCGTQSLYCRATWHVWLLSTDTTSPGSNVRVVKNVKADVQRALLAGIGAITTAGANGLAVPTGALAMRHDLMRAGVAVGVMEYAAEYEIAFTDAP